MSRRLGIDRDREGRESTGGQTSACELDRIVERPSALLGSRGIAPPDCRGDDRPVGGGNETQNSAYGGAGRHGRERGVRDSDGTAGRLGRKKVDTKGATAKLTLLAGGDKTAIALVPVGENGLEAKGVLKMEASTKAVATITLAGKPAITARFEIK